jgi:hypothetical protein
MRRLSVAGSPLMLQGVDLPTPLRPALRSGAGNNDDDLSVMAGVDLAAECRRL